MNTKSKNYQKKMSGSMAWRTKRHIAICPMCEVEFATSKPGSRVFCKKCYRKARSA